MLAGVIDVDEMRWLPTIKYWVISGPVNVQACLPRPFLMSVDVSDESDENRKES